jgi:hypothetical protein
MRESVMVSVGRLISICVRQSYGSTSCLRLVPVRLDRMAAVRPPRALPTKRLFLRLCQDFHNAVEHDALHLALGYVMPTAALCRVRQPGAILHGELVLIMGSGAA